MKDLPSGDTEEIRREFEAHFRRDYQTSYARNETGCYIDWLLELRWVGWQAAVATKQAELDAAETRSRIDAANANSVVKQLAVVKAELDAANAKIAQLTREHTTKGTFCWCDPKVEERPDGSLLVIHNKD